MVNSISRSFIRDLVDELGLNSSVDKDGEIRLILSADKDFGHDVYIFISVRDEKFFRIYGMAENFEATSSNAARTLVAINKYNLEKSFGKACLTDKGYIVVERDELLDEDVSEEFIKNNCIKEMVAVIWRAFVFLGQEI